MLDSLSMRSLFKTTLLLLLCSTFQPCPAATRNIGKPLQVYFVDVEGGQATLFVTPQQESLLIDTGWPGNNYRDANRIEAAVKMAGLRKIDYVLITHYHTDHVGGVPQLAEKIPIGTFIDHGPNREQGTQELYQTYHGVIAAKKTKHLIAKPGDHLPIRGMSAVIASGDGQLIERPLPGAGEQNQFCATSEKRTADQTENARSLGAVITFGKLKIVDLGDLTWDKEMELMCPANKIGTAQIYIVSHHGSKQSGSPALVHAIGSRVAIMDNGAKKGGSPSAWSIVRSAPGLEDLWQLHFSEEGGKEHNVADPFIANLGSQDAGNYLKLTVYPDGRFEMFNSRTKETKRYSAAVI